MGLRVAKRIENVFKILRVVVRKEQIDDVQRLIAFDSSRQWRADHSAYELGDGCGVHGTAEAHHYFGTRTIPTGSQRSFE